MNKKISLAIGLANIAPLYIFMVRYVVFAVETVPFERCMIAVLMAIVGGAFIAHSAGAFE